jgi:hypothetical protein
LAVFLFAACCDGTSSLTDDIVVLRTSSMGLHPSAAAVLEEAQRHARTRLTGVAVGGVAGLLAGAFPAQSAGGSGGASAVYAAAGGVGMALGYAYGEYIAARNARANMDQDKLRILIEAAQKDRRTYEGFLDTAGHAVNESERAVTRLREEQILATGRRAAYQQQARNLTAIAVSLRLASRELQDNLAVMQTDIQEARDVRKMIGDRVEPEGLIREFSAQQDTLVGIVRQYQRIEVLAAEMPPEVRPTITPELQRQR